MSTLFDPSLSLSQFQLPPLDIQVLSFCKSNKLLPLKNWADDLKLTQVNPTSVVLYRAVPEVVRLKTTAKTRFEMLEHLWHPLQQCLVGLSKEFLQQPLILPEKARNAAVLAQALQKHLVDGYTLCVLQMVEQNRLKSGQQDLVLAAIARALQAISLVVLRSLQLYSNVPGKLWLRAHVLYQVAEYFEINNKILPQKLIEESGLRSVQELYIRLVALGCTRPNQLSQSDIHKTFTGLCSWVKHIGLLPSATAEPNNFYLVDLNEDCGPINKNRFDGPPTHRVVELDFQSLVSQLSKLSGTKNGDDWGNKPALTIPADISSTLVAHMLDCWSNSAQRHQERQRADIDAEACIGMIDCHFHLCGGIDFQNFLHPHSEPDDDFLSGGFDNLVASLSKKENVIDKPKTDRQTVFQIVIQNISAGGYCLLWQGDLPSKIEAGELVGLRERGRRAWSIGVIRWVRQLKDASQLGIQLLTNQPVPYGAAVTYDMGGYSDHMRAIHIPAPMMANQPPSLLTGPMPFQENSRVKLKQDDQNLEVRLNRCIFSTSKLKLFSFETLAADEEDF